MFINKLGPKEIFNRSDEAPDFCKEDSPESVEKYKKFYQAGGEGEFLNGYSPDKNILITAVIHANVSLVKYIVENADPKILDMRDRGGKSALHHTIFYVQPTEKILACAQLLIQAGANIDTRWWYKQDYDESNLPPAESALEEDNFVGSNVLGALARSINHPALDEKEKNERLTQLFLACGATKGYVSICDTSFQGWISVEDDVKEQDTSERARYVRALKQMAEKNLNWEKSRLLFLGQKDPNSHLAHLPEDLLKMLFQKITQPTV